MESSSSWRNPTKAAKLEIARNIVVIAWTQVSRRSQELARELGATYLRLDRVDHPKWKIVLTLARNFIKTLRWLVDTRPDLVITFHAHPLITLCGYIYSKLFNKQYIADIHTAGFLDYDFFPARQLSSFLWKRAVRIIVHNPEARDYLESAFNGLDSKIVVLEDPIPQIPVSIKISTHPRPMCVFICRFSSDEPFHEFLNAAKVLIGVDFYITGNVRKVPGLAEQFANDHIHFTGFIPDEQYFDLLNQADFVVALTTRPYTLMSAGYEALALGKPLIVTNSSPLRTYFGSAAVYTENRAGNIQSAISQLLENLPDKKSQIHYLKSEKIREWSSKAQVLLNTIGMDSV